MSEPITPVDPVDEPIVDPVVGDPPATTAVAILSSDGTYMGVGEIVDLDQLAPGQVPVPADCDLLPGRYRWDSDKQTFMPIDRGSPVDRTPPPEAIEGIAFGLLSAWKSGMSLHEKTLSWLDGWLTSIDKMKSVDGGENVYSGDALVVDYAIARSLLKGRQ